MGRSLKKKDVAEFFGVSLPTVDSWVRNGCPVEVEGTNGRAYELDSQAVHGWLLDRERRRATGTDGEPEIDPETGETKITYDEAQRRKAIADAKSAEIRLAKEVALVAPIEAITKVVSNEIARARARLLAIPTKFRPDAQVHAASPERAKTLVSKVDELIFEALSEIKTYGGAK